MLNDAEVDKLVNLINDSFRVQPNHTPVYVETSNNLERVSAKQHQVIFGRRGSGKSCLLVTSHLNASESSILSVYTNADTVKRLSYPDLLIRILIDLLNEFPKKKRRFGLRRESLAGKEVRDLKKLLDEAETQTIARNSETRKNKKAEIGTKKYGFAGSMGEQLEQTSGLKSEYTEQKLDHLERHLADYRAAIVEGIVLSKKKHAALILDDFYLIPLAVQPDVVDYIHSLVRGTDCYLKVGTIRHRSKLIRAHGGQTIGIERRQDYESIDLDQTFENVERTRDYLKRMLDSMGERVGIKDATSTYLSADALLHLTLASGGVPRDFLNIFAEAVASARASGTIAKLTPTFVYKGAARESYQTKMRNFREDAGTDYTPLEHLYNDLSSYCLSDKKKTAFLISESEAQSDALGHELIRQLMDLKLIHVIEPDTSAASGRPGRYEAYTLDFAGFMEPRKRNIEIVEFWKKDDNRRPQGIREAPVYSLARGRAAAEQTTSNNVTAIESEDGLGSTQDEGND